MHTIKVCCLNTQPLLFHSSCCASYWWSQQHGCCNCDNAIKSGNVYNKMTFLYRHSKRQCTWLSEKDSRGTPHWKLAGSHKLNHFKCHREWLTSLLFAGTGFQSWVKTRMMKQECANATCADALAFVCLVQNLYHYLTWHIYALKAFKVDIATIRVFTQDTTIPQVSAATHMEPNLAYGLE